MLAKNAPALSDLEELLSYAALDHNVTHTEALKALTTLERIRGATERMILIQELHSRSPLFMERMFDNLERNDRTKAWRTTLVWTSLYGGTKAVTSMLSTAPEAVGIEAGKDKKAPVEVELLLSKLDRSLLIPLARGGGEPAANARAWLEMATSAKVAGLKHHFDVLEHEAAAQHKQAQALAESSETMMQGATPADAAMKRSVNTIRDLMSYGTFDIEITDAEALKGYKLLAGLGSADAVRKVVYQLDKGPWMDRFIDNLSHEDRWAEPRTFLSLLSARTPAKNIRFAQELLSYSSDDIEILDEEARLAFAIVKALPLDDQHEFRALDDGKWWERMHEELPEDPKMGLGAGLYANDEESNGLKASFAGACATMPQAQLKQQAEMLFRMGEVDFVEQAVIGAGLDGSTQHGWLFSDYGLATTNSPRDEKVWATWERGKTSRPKALGIGQALSAAAHQLSPLGGGTRNIDLQAAVGDSTVAGITLARRDSGNAEQNMVGLNKDRDTGEFTFTTSSLALASVNRLSDGMSLQSGPITLTDVRVVARWKTANGEPRLLIEVGGLHIADLSMVSADAMTAIGAVELGGLRLETVPIGDKPEDKLDATLQLLDEVTTALQDMLAGVDFSEPEPGAVAESLGASLMGERRANISCDKLHIHNYATSAGDFIGAVDVQGIQLAVDHELVTEGVRRDIEALEAIDEPTRTQTSQLIMARGRLAELEVDERRLKALEAKPEEALKPHEREMLRALRNQLTVVKAQVNVDSAALSNVDMAGTQVKSAKARGLSASMTTQKVAPGAHGGAGRNQHMEATVAVDHFEVEELVQEGTSRLQAFEARVAELKAKLESNRATKADADLYKTLSDETNAQRAKVSRRDELKLTREPTPEQQAEFNRLNQELTPWETKTGGRKMARLAVSGVSGGYNAQSNSMLMRVGQSHIEGLEQDGAKVDSIATTDTRIGLDLKGTMKTSLANDASLMDQLTRLDVRSGAMDIKGLELNGKKASDALRGEFEALQLKQTLTPQSMSERDKRRHTALPALLEKAEAADKRLAELRDLQREQPNSFGPEHAAELKSLRRFDATIKRVATIQATNAALGLDAKRGKITVGVEGTEDRKGLAVEGIEQARIVDGEEVVDARTRFVGADKLRGGVASAPKGPRAADDSTHTGLPDFLKIQQDKASLAAAVDAEGFELRDHEEGTQGEAGHRKIGRLDGTLKASYDSTRKGGSLQVDVDNASLKKFKARAASKIEAAYGARQALQERLEDGEPSDKDLKQLKALDTQIATYESLVKRFKTAKSRRAKRALKRRLKRWTKEVQTTIKRLDIKDTQGTITGVGNPLAQGYDLGAQNIGIEPGASIGGFSLTGMQHGSTRVGELNLNGINVNQATNLLDPTKRRLGMTAASGNVKGLKMGAFWAQRAKFRGLNANLQGNNLSGRLRAGSGAGLGYGRTGVGMFAGSGINFGVSNIGSGNQTVSASAASMRTKGVNHRGKAMKVALKKMSGKRARFSAGPGGKLSFKLDDFNVEGFNFVTPQLASRASGKDGPTEYSLGKKTGDGLEVTMSDTQGVTAKVKQATAEGLVGTEIGDDGRTVEIEKVVVDGLEATIRPDGSIELLVDNADVFGGRWDDGKGHQSNIDGRLSGKGTPKTRAKLTVGADGKFRASAGQLEVFRVDINEKTLKATLRLGVITDGAVSFDPKSGALDASAKAALIQDGQAEVTGDNGETTGVGAKEASATGLHTTWDPNKGMLTGSATTAAVDGVSLLSGAPGAQTGMKLDHAGLLGGNFQADMAQGIYSGSADQAIVNGLTQVAPSGETKLGNMLAVGAHGAYNANTGAFGGAAKTLSASNLALQQRLPQGALNAGLASAQADNLQVTGNANTGALSLDFTKLQLGAGHLLNQDGVMDGLDGDASRLQAQFAGLTLGDGKSSSSLSRDAQGRLTSDLKGVELDAARSADGKLLPLMTQHSFGLMDESKPDDFSNRELLTQQLLLSDLNGGNKGADLSLDRVLMQDFDPANPTSAGSLLKLQGIHTGNLHYTSGRGHDGDNKSMLKANGQVDSAYVAGLGDGKMMAGFKGLKDGKFEVFGSKKHQGLARQLGVNDIDATGGFVLLGPANGKDLGVLYSQLEEFTTGTINLDYTFEGKKFGSYEEALADYKLRKSAWDKRPPFDITKDNIDISALDNAFGKLAMTYIYDKDHGVTESALTGREAKITTDIQHGKLDAGALEVRGQGLFGAPIADIAQGVSKAGDLVGLDPLNWGLGLAGVEMPGYTNNAGPQIPVSGDYNAPTTGALNDIRLRELSLGSIQGGRMQLGRQFGADIQGAWGLKLSSGGRLVGNQLGIEGSGFNAKNVKANDGNVKADTVGIGPLKLEVRNAATKSPILSGQIEGVTIKNASVGKLPIDTIKGLTDKHQQLTKKP